jgi:FkbM family methyltransferase
MAGPDFQHEYDTESAVLVYPQKRNFFMYVTPRYKLHYQELAFEEFSADFLSRMMGQARLFIDVGAHYGFYALLAARQNRGLEVMALEPTPETCQLLKRNIALNRLKNVAVHQIALSDKDGEVAFNVSLASDSCGFHPNPEAPPVRQISVASRRLDSLLAQHEPCPTLLKMDTEGHELAVLKGMTGTLERFPDIQLVIEFNPLMQRAASHAESDLLSYLKSIDFAAFFLDESSRLMIPIESQEQLSGLVASTGYGNVYCARSNRIGQFSHGRQKLQHNIDSPQAWKIESREVLIRGWCFGNRNIVVQAVRARRGQRVWNARYGLLREDLRRAFPQEAAAARSGFEVCASVPILPARLRLEAQDQFGRWHPFMSRCVSHWRRLLRGTGRKSASLPSVSDSAPDLVETLQFNVCVLAVSHSDYRSVVAGTQKLLQQEEALLAARGVSYLEIHPVPQSPGETLTGIPVGVYADSKFIGSFPAGRVRQMLRELVSRGIVLQAVHVHHLLGFDWDMVKELLLDLEGRRVFFIHDFYSVCTQFNLLKNERDFCGGPSVDSQECRECSHGEARRAHFQAFGEFLEAWKPEFVAPSEVARAVWLKSYPQFADQVRVVPHLALQPGGGKILERPVVARIRIAYVGYQHPFKGWGEWAGVTSVLSRDHYECFVLGSCTESLPDVQYLPVSFVEHGADAMRKALGQHSIDIAFLWSLVPETYSFTLYESMAAGCFILTNPASGNIAAQVRQTGRGWVADGVEEALGFLLDHQQVAARLAEFRKNHPPFELLPNPLLADEIARQVSSGKPQKRTGANGTLRQNSGAPPLASVGKVTE